MPRFGYGALAADTLDTGMSSKNESLCDLVKVSLDVLDRNFTRAVHHPSKYVVVKRTAYRG